MAEVLPLLDALTAELAIAGYGDDGTFGYSAAQLEAGGVYLVGASVAGVIVGVGGIEFGADGVAELKRFYVNPEHRGSGAASVIMASLLREAANQDVHKVRLETGDEQHAAIRFYSRHGFNRIDRFGPYVSSATSVCMERSLVPR